MFYKVKSGTIINLNHILLIPNKHGAVYNTYDEPYYEVEFIDGEKRNIGESDLNEIKRLIKIKMVK